MEAPAPSLPEAPISAEPARDDFDGRGLGVHYQTLQSEQLGWGEKTRYSVGDAGSSFYWKVFALSLTFYYTDSALRPPGSVTRGRGGGYTPHKQGGTSMLHRLAWALALTLAAALGSGADLEDIQKRGALKVIAQKGEAPEMFRLSGSGEPGFEREMLQGFAALYDLSFEPVPVGTSADRIPALLRGDGDVIAGIVDTASRRERIAFTPEVLPAHHLVVTCTPGPTVQTIEELQKARVGVVDGTSWKEVAIAAGVSAAQMTLFPTREPVFQALEGGQIAATVMTTTDFLLAARLHPCLEGGTGLGAPGSAGWGVRKESTDLQAALEAYISNYRAGPSWNRLIVKYFGDQALRALGRE